MTVDPAAFVPPALHPFSGDMHFKSDLFFARCKRSDIIDSTGVSGTVFPRLDAVNKKSTFAEDTVKFKKNSLVFKELRDLKALLIHAASSGKIGVVAELKVSLFADTGDIVLFGKSALFNTPVMGQIKSPGREFAKIRK